MRAYTCAFRKANRSVKTKGEAVHIPKRVPKYNPNLLKLEQGDDEIFAKKTKVTHGKPNHNLLKLTEDENFRPPQASPLNTSETSTTTGSSSRKSKARRSSHDGASTSRASAQRQKQQQNAKDSSSRGRSYGNDGRYSTSGRRHSASSR